MRRPKGTRQSIAFVPHNGPRVVTNWRCYPSVVGYTLVIFNLAAGEAASQSDDAARGVLLVLIQGQTLVLVFYECYNGG